MKYRLMVDVAFVLRFPQVVTLKEMKANSDLEGMRVLRRGQRLSITPVEKTHFEILRRLARQ